MQARERVRLRVVRALPGAQPRARPALRRVLRGLRLRLRRAARRLRAGDEDAPRWHELFGELKAELVPLIATLAERSERRRLRACTASFPSTASAELVRRVVRRMGFDPEGWRLDDAVHPFATSFGSARRAHHHALGRDLLPVGAVRRDARMRPRAVRGGDRRRRCSARRSATAESLGLHESQSRLWENMVGRGRPFCGVLAPLIGEAFGALPSLDPDDPVPRRQPGRAVVHPGRGRRGHLRAAHRAALRARAGADRGPAGGRRAARGVERPLQGVPRARGARRRRTACSRTSTGRRV